MPVFEYKCNDCATKYDFFNKSSLNQEEITCPKCGSKNNKKLFSAFATANSSDSDFSSSSCASGNCSTDYSGGCASGMCGLN
ncbi:MAG: zinc ribbon domain-containing protein [Ignavibacteriaceae bacterium]|nr:zinc ribbon domain-containing protein [Ignavibacteriaceae bacterium]